MKLTLKRDLPLMLAVLLAIWCMWYARPVGVDTLFPGLEPASDFQFRYAVGDRSSFLHNSFLLILFREDTKESE